MKALEGLRSMGSCQATPFWSAAAGTVLVLAVAAASPPQACTGDKDDLPKLEKVGDPVAVFEAREIGTVTTITFSPAGDAVVIHGARQGTFLADASRGVEIAHRLPGPKTLSIGITQRNPVTGDPGGREAFGLDDGPATDSVFDSTGKTVTGVDCMGNIFHWDAATGKPAGKPIIQTKAQLDALSMSFDAWAVLSPDGKQAGIPWLETDKCGLRIVGTSKAAPGVKIPCGFGKSVTFSPDGTRLLVGWSNGVAQQWDTTTGKAVGPPLKHREADDNPIRGVRYSPDGKTALTMDQQTTRLWDAATGKAVGDPFGTGVSQAGYEFERLVYFRADSSRVTKAFGNLLVVDTATGKVLKDAKPDRSKIVIGVSPDGKRAAAVSARHCLFVYDPETGETVASEPGPEADNFAPYLAVFSPDGRTIAVAYQADGVQCAVQFWRMTTYPK